MKQYDNRSSDQYSEILAALDKSGQHFVQAGRAYPVDLRSMKPNEIAFSGTEIVYHMLAVEALWSARITGLLQRHETEFVPLNPDELAKSEQHNMRDFEQGLSDFAAARKETLSIAKDMKIDDRLRQGNHPKYGPMTIAQIYELMAKHDANHADQFSRTLKLIAPLSGVDQKAII